VSDLSITATTDTSVSLAFIAVDDGAGLPASYDVRLAVAPLSWGTASSVSWGSCSTPVAGVATGATVACTVLGLRPAGTYEFQLVAYRGTLDVDAVFGELSNSARATTDARTPGAVTDLAVGGTTDTTVTLTFTEVNDGTGLPASYDVRFAAAPLSWGSALNVAQGTCKIPMSGTAIGTQRTCKVRGLDRATRYQFQLVAFRDTFDVNAVFGALSNIATGTTRAAAKPGTVHDLAIVGTTDSAVTLSFTEVGDGTGQPANYDIRSALGGISWPSASSIARGSCATPVVGSAIGANRTCTVHGLAASTGYQFQLVTFRGTLNTASAVFGNLSNVVTDTTAAPQPALVSVASVSVSPPSTGMVVGRTAQFTAALQDASGNALSGRVVTWSMSNALVATVSDSGLVTGVSAGSATMTATSEGKSGTAAISVSPAVTNPGTVSNLAVAGVTPTSVTLSFTEVTDGAGQPASYDVRYAAGSLSWGTAFSATNGTCTSPLTGSAIGATRTCTVAGLTAVTSYQFELVAHRGTLDVDAVFGALSNVAAGTTSASAAPVASVTLSPASVSLSVGGTQQLTASLRDANGTILSGRTVTWASSAPLLAGVNGGGMVSGLAVGGATITATSEGQSGGAAITVLATLPPPPPPPPPPPSPSGEPVLNVAAGDLPIFQTDMDAYTSPAQMDAIAGPSIHGFYDADYPNNYFVISGRGGSGHAIRLVYLQGPDRLLWKTNPENNNWYSPANAPIVLQYWFRISKNGGAGGSPGYGSTAVGMKWVEFWRMGQSDRTQFGPTAGNATTGPLWSLHAGGSSLIMGYQPVGPYWNQLNNNEWHRATYLLQPASAPGAADGIARMWVDGTKIVDISAAAAGVTPPGGTKVWCTMAEVAQLDTYQTGLINLGEYMNGRSGDGVTDLPMTLDFDDFAWWRLAARVP